MFCPKCGNEIQGNAKFCGKCGAVLKADAPEASKTAKAEAGVAVQKIIAGVENVASRIAPKIQKWLTDYLDTWRQVRKLGEKEKYLWFGIHGGVVLLLLCVVILPAFSGMGFKGLGSRTDIGKIFEEAIEDKDISEEDITRLAQAVSDYGDLERLMSVYGEGFGNGLDREVTGYLNAYLDISNHCRDLSGLGTLTDEYSEWYDRDGLTEKIFGKPDQVEYISLDWGDMSPISAEGDGDVFHSDADGNFVEVEWFTFADSDEITFIKTSGSDSEYETERFDGKFEIFGTEFVVTLDGKEYRLSEAATDLARQQGESFLAMSAGVWGYSEEFCNMLASNLGDWEEFNNKYNDPPLYFSFGANGGRDPYVRGVDGVHLKWIPRCEYEQGEGKTVTISTSKGSLEAAYDKVGSNLVITVDGTDYTLSPTTIVQTGTYDAFGSRVK